MAKRALQSNEDLVKDLMTYSPHGSLAQVFIIEAIRKYSKQIIKADPASLDNALISGATWQAIAKDVEDRCVKFYGRHDDQDQNG